METGIPNELFIVVSALDLEDLGKKVTEKFAKGWRLHGGIVFLEKQRPKQLYAQGSSPYESYIEYFQFLAHNTPMEETNNYILYNVVSGSNLEMLAENIRELLTSNNGWNLHGGIMMQERKRQKQIYQDDESPYESYIDYIQFLVFYAKPKKTEEAANSILGAGRTKRRRNRKNRTRRH